MKRPAFKVTGGVVCALAMIGFAKVVLEPYLPSSPTSPLITLSPDQRLPEPVVDIKWEDDLDVALSKAKAKDKGLLVFLAEPASNRARPMEVEMLRDDEIVRFIRRHFIAVRINLDEKPEWEGLLFPLSRSQNFFVPGCTLFVSDAKGTILSDWTFRTARPLYKESILGFLVQAKKAVVERARNLDYETPTSTQMQTDINRLRLAPAEPIPDTNAFLERVRNELEPTSGTYGTGGIIQFRPLVLRVLMQETRLQEAAALAKNAFRSNIYDVIDGGFFESMEWSEIRNVDTSKRACRNALAAEVLAELAVATKDPEIRDAAMDVAKAVLTDFRDGSSFVAGRADDVSPNRRSHRYSLTQAKLEKILPAADIAWVRRNLLSRDAVGREMGTLADGTTINNRDYMRIRNVLRLRLPEAAKTTQPDRVGVMGYIAARLYRIGVLLDREDFIETAREQTERCFQAMDTNQVQRLYGNRDAGTGWLGSYLGVVDAALADYCYTGRPDSLVIARRVFAMATERFGVPGTSYLGCQELRLDSPLVANMPQLVDLEGESLSSMAIRLSFVLSVLESDASQHELLVNQISSASGTLAPLLSNAGSVVAGYYSVARCAVAPRGVVVTGARAIDRVRSEVKNRPNEWVVPLIGEVRKDWNLKPDRVYEFNGNQIIGEIRGAGLAKTVENSP
jgi:uncharacterized protein YyaL (SSP411 family)